MKYNKNHKTYEEQADLLISRNFQGDKDKIIILLKRMNYYRLTGYLYPFKSMEKNHESYKDCNIDNILKIISVENDLCRIIYAMIREFEIGVKTKIVYLVTKQFGPFGYLEKKNFPLMKENRYNKLLEDLTILQRKNRIEPFIKHFFDKYGDKHKYLPLWMACEIMTVGMIFNLYNGLSIKLQKQIAAEFNVTNKIFKSWFLSINGLRNIIAHQGRVWKREIGLKPLIPQKIKKWHQSVEITNNKLLGVLTVLYFLLVSMKSSKNYKIEIKKVFNRNENFLKDYGFPKDWEESEIWEMKE